MTQQSETVHATAVAFAGRGLLLVGPSGSGKSGLALQMMAHGAALIADDRVMLTREGDEVVMRCPPTIAGLIEARGIGVLNAQPYGEAPLAWVVDLAKIETKRSPDPRNVSYLGCNVPLLWRVDTPHFAVMLLHLLAHGRSTR